MLKSEYNKKKIVSINLQDSIDDRIDDIEEETLENPMLGKYFNYNIDDSESQPKSTKGPLGKEEEIMKVVL